LLIENGYFLNNVLVDINNPDKNVEWLPIELFDDTTFDDFSNEEWMARAE
jgi:dynein heavy chain